MIASVLLDVVWAMGAGDIALFIGLLAAAMWINHRDNKRNAALWAAYLAEHPEIGAQLGVTVRSRAAVTKPAERRVMTGKLPAYAGGGGPVRGGGPKGGAEEQVHG